MTTAESYLELIRVALTDDATDDQKHQAAAACRTLAAALDATPGEPLDAPTPPAPAPSSAATPAAPAALDPLRQLGGTASAPIIEALIDRLRAPRRWPGPPRALRRGVQVPFVAVPVLGRGKP